MANGINSSGEIVGCYISCSGGYLYNGTFSYIQDGQETSPTGINDSSQIVGFMRQMKYSGPFSGFFYSNGVFNTINVPGAVDTYAYAINNNGQIVGDFDGGPGVGGGHFLYSNGIFTTINLPGTPYGINNSGQIVGTFGDNTTGIHGFLDTGGTITTIDVPGAVGTSAYGINDSGQIVGGFSNATGDYGFVDTGGIFTTLVPPGAVGSTPNGCCIGTGASGINDSGQIVGLFYGASFGSSSYLAELAPEPRSSPVLAACLIGLFATAYCRRRASNQNCGFR